MSMSFEREVITDLFTVVPDRRLKQKQNEASNDKKYKYYDRLRIVTKFPNLIRDPIHLYDRLSDNISSACWYNTK